MTSEHGGLPHDDVAPHIARLGLLSEPFAGTGDGQHFFYADANREQRLDLMQHLAPYSELLVVIGVPGVGKTTLLQQFVTRASETWRVAVVTAQSGMDRDEFMARMMEAFGLPGDDRSPAEAQRALLITHLRALRQSAQVPMLLVDDAHQLDAEVLELVLSLVEENDAGHLLSVMLFGNPALQSHLAAPALAALQSRIAHSFDIPPLNEQETARYIRHRMRAAGAQDDGPFNAVVTAKIHDASGGIPSAINEMAHHFLSDAPGAKSEERGRSPGRQHAVSGAKTGIDKRWIAVAVAGVAVIAVLVAGRLGEEDTGGAPGEVPSIALPLPPPGEGEGESRVLRDEGEPALGEAPADTVLSEPLPEQAASGASVPPPEVAPEMADEAAPPPAPAAPVKPAPVAPPPKAVEPPVTKPAVAPAPVAVAPGGIKREAWLREQPPGNFTLQLMALKNENDVRRAVERHALQGQVAYFAIQRNGQTLYALVYGTYPSRDEAVRAAKKLPAGLVSGQPWVRTFKSIHDDIRQ